MNPNVSRNLAAFARYYPKEVDRVAQIVNRPGEVPIWPECNQFDVPSSLPEGQYPRILLIHGFPHPNYIPALMSSPSTQFISLFLIVEPDEDKVRQLFHHTLLEPLFAHPRFAFLFTQSQRELEANFFNLLKQNINSCIMENVLALHPKETNKHLEYHEQSLATYERAVQHVYHNYGRIDDSLEGIRSSLENILDKPEALGIGELKNSCRGAAAVVVGAGPSLDAAIPFLKTHRDKHILICVDAALKPLLAAGIEPDYVTAIERENLWQVKFYEGLEPLTSAELVCFPVVHKKVLDAFPGSRMRFCYRNYSWFAHFEVTAPRGILRCGGSAGHLGIRFAYFLGCSSVGFVGLDACYEVQEGRYRTHCKNTAYPEWGEYSTLDELAEKRKHGPFVPAICNDGSETMTQLTYYQWASEILEDALELPFYPVSLSAKSVKIPRIDFVEPEAFFADKKPVQKRLLFNTIKHYSKKHKDLLLQQINAYLARASVFYDMLPEVESAEDVNDFNYAIFHAFYSDNLFVSFVVQCAAVECFKLENMWTGLPYEVDKRPDLRKNILRLRLDVIRTVLIKLYNILDIGSMTRDGKQISESGSV